MSLQRSIRLNNGVELPQIGLGTWQSDPGQVEKAVEHAIKTGYRHIDAAVVYDNQREVATGIKNGGVSRSELFVVSKLWNTSHRPELVEADLDNTLAQLETEYLDLYLIHWPVPFKPGRSLQPVSQRDDGKGAEKTIDRDAPSIVETWKEMVRLQKETKKIRAIGVSNFSISHLDMIITATGVTPAVNQVEAHPLLYQQDLVEYCAKHNIHITAYSPLGQNITGKTPVIEHRVVKQIADKLDKTAAQVLIAWGVSKGYSVIPKSVTPSRIESNFQQTDLSQEDIDAISRIAAAEGRMRYNVPMVYEPRWDIDVFGEGSEKGASVKVW